MVVRRVVRKIGVHFRLHPDDLPGCPDIVFPGLRKVIFVHGCFWHGHPSCKRARLPKKNAKIWFSKIEANRARDRKVVGQLKKSGWASLVVWECSTSDIEKLKTKLLRFLA
jgi:DNA mismatch endonuclease (patch repair protein)